MGDLRRGGGPCAAQAAIMRAAEDTSECYHDFLKQTAGVDGDVQCRRQDLRSTAICQLEKD